MDISKHSAIQSILDKSNKNWTKIWSKLIKKMIKLLENLQIT